MKHLTFGDKSLLIGDEIAEALIEYAAALASVGRADTVIIHALGADGNDVEAILLLNEGTSMMAETATTTVTEPDNGELLAHLNEQVLAIQSPPAALPDVQENYEQFDDYRGQI